MPSPSLRRRLVAGTLALSVLAGPVLYSSAAAGDGISDKRAEAAKVADQLDTLQEQAEVYAEQYNDAKIALGKVGAKVLRTKAAVARSRKEIAKRQREVARYAVGAYTRGGDDKFAYLLGSDGSDVTERDGYVTAAVGNRQDLVARLQAAEAANQDKVADLAKAEAAMAKVQSTLTQKREDADAKVAEQKALYRKVQGELRTLVAQEQARRAAEAARKAKAAADAAAAKARAAAPPPAPKVTNPTTPAPSTGGGGTTTTTTPPSGGGGGGGGTTTTTPPSAPPAPEPPVGSGSGAAIAAARSVIGTRYTWGGASPSAGFDCSGLTMWAWAHGGKSLPHSSRAQYSMSRRIPISSLQPGDLVFYGNGTVSHVGLYIGGGQMIHAPHTGSYVQVSSIYYWNALIGAGRI